MSEIGWQLIAAVRSAAARDPYRVDASAGRGGCQYVRNGQPSCIIGEGLWALGLIDASLESLGGTPVPLSDFVPLNADLAPSLFRHLGLELDEDEIGWLAMVQSKQDEGVCWTDAVREADHLIERVTTDTGVVV